MESATPPGRASLALALLADSRLPAGGYTQSSGLEGAIGAGLGLGDIPAYIAARLATVVPTDAGAAVLTASAIQADAAGPGNGIGLGGGSSGGDGGGGGGIGGGGIGHQLNSIWLEWAARTPNPVLRRTAEQAGRGYMRLAAYLWPNHPGLAAARQAEQTRAAQRSLAKAYLPRPLALGLVAACAGLNRTETAYLVGYEDVATLVAACPKLLPADPLVCTRWLFDSLDTVEALADQLADLDQPDQIPAPSAPQIEAWATTHALKPERLFHA
ncbi:MAG: hypothetical protein LBO75_04985 [Bifidobacteriaceae bacterium]|nr:hypothetical protein [Bifidobacteriaceae bacterium]